MAVAGEALRKAGIDPVPPGTIFSTLFLKPENIGNVTAADNLGVDPTFLERFLENREPVTEWLADRLSRFTGTTKKFWLNLQAARDAADSE